MRQPLIRAFAPPGAVSVSRLVSRALVAATVATSATQLACASRGAARTTPAATAAATDSSRSVREDGGKTVERLFAGRFPGVSVTQADGGGLQIRIRGGSNSFYASNEPLYIVDDSPLPPGTGGIVALNPYDIEKIEVLKNPVDTGVYGVRGANGVIRITTVRPGRR